MTGVAPKTPGEVAKEAYRAYYAAGEFCGDRYVWTIRTFLPSCQGKRILEVGCGNGKLLEMLKSMNEVVGVDASTDGIGACVARGIEGHCIDASSEPMPFADESFDIVICLETIEHMMNPFFALTEMRRVLRHGGRFVCSVPNPIWGHPLLYPGLFEYKYFRRFLEQCDFQITRVEPWQWAPRETILPRSLRGVGMLRSRYVAGLFRRILALAWQATGHFPAFCYWLWTFDAVKVEKGNAGLLIRQSVQTAPKG